VISPDRRENWTADGLVPITDTAARIYTPADHSIKL
jgi:hypothetical protein